MVPLKKIKTPKVKAKKSAALKPSASAPPLGKFLASSKFTCDTLHRIEL